jgi:hypothetical protein
MMINQVSLYAWSEVHAQGIKKTLGLTDAGWIKDEVTAHNWLASDRGWHESQASVHVTGHLGIQLEIVRYTSGGHWHKDNPNYHNAFTFLSHFGVLLDKGEDWPPHSSGMRLVQETKVIKRKAFTDIEHFRIYEISPASYIKYTKRNP